MLRAGYKTKVYCTPGNHHLWFLRTRVYIDLIRGDQGGDQALRRAELLVKVSANFT